MADVSTAPFNTITAADWTRELARARATPNSVSLQIQKHLSLLTATRPKPTP